MSITPSDSPDRIALAHEIAEAEGLPLELALDEAALVEQQLLDIATTWDRRARTARRRTLDSFITDWDAAARAAGNPHA